MELKDKKIIIIGSNGLLGSAFLQKIPSENLVLGLSKDKIPDNPQPNLMILDIREMGQTTKIIKDFSPDVIIHTAALTNLDLCEKNQKEAWEVNVEGTRNLASASQEVNATFVYVSTDYVFDGTKGKYKEEDSVNPINYYAKTKYEGEKIARELPNHLICRTSVLYGNHPRPNFVVWTVRELQQNHRINIVNDQYNSPTLSDDLAEIILKLVEEDQTGTFHTAGSERINRLDFTKKITEIFDLDYTLINPISSDELTWVAKRPMDSSLDVSKVSKIKRPLNIEEGLTRMRDTQ